MTPRTDDLDAVRAELGDPPHHAADLADPDAPARVMAAAVDHFGRVDVLVANHARSALGTLDAVTAESLDAAWAVNARAAVLLVQAYAAQPTPPRDGRVVLFTSGQHRGPMPGELPYAISKAAVYGMTASLAEAVRDRGITVNAVAPGPIDTGWAGPELLATGAFGRPEDVAGLVAFLAGPDSAWVNGQVLDADGGARG